MDDRISQARGPLPVQLRATYAAAVAGLAVFILLALLFPAPIHSYNSRTVVEQRTAAEHNEPFEFARLKQEQVEQMAQESFLAYAPQAGLTTSFNEAVNCTVERRTPHCVEIVIETQDRYADQSLALCQRIANDLVDRADKSFIPGIDALRIQRSNVEQRLMLVRESRRAAEDELTTMEREHLAQFTAALEQATVGKTPSDPLAAESLRLDGERQRLLAQRNDLARTKTDNHPQVKEIDERIAETNGQISALAAKLRTASSKTPNAKQQLAAMQDDFRRKSQELSESIARDRRREEELLSEAARLAVTPAAIPLYTVVVQEPQVVHRNGGQPSGWKMLLLTILSLAASAGTYTAFRRFASQQLLSTAEDIEAELGLPVLTLASPPSATPSPLGMGRLMKRSLVGVEVTLLVLAASAVLLVTMQSELARHPARDPLGALAESLDRTFGPTLRR
jgi:hypothetical protein